MAWVVSPTAEILLKYLFPRRRISLWAFKPFWISFLCNGLSSLNIAIVMLVTMGEFYHNGSDGGLKIQISFRRFKTLWLKNSHIELNLSDCIKINSHSKIGLDSKSFLIQAFQESRFWIRLNFFASIRGRMQETCKENFGYWLQRNLNTAKQLWKNSYSLQNK